MSGPSVDRANGGTQSGCLRATFSKLLQDIDGMLPARVISYDRIRNIATVQPMIQLLSTDGTTHSRAQIASVPVLAIGGGDFVLSFPVSPGDFGWIEASDRDISLFMQQQAEAAPNTLRKHSFSDGRFIPDKIRSYTIAGDDDGAVVLQNLSGTCKLSLRPDDSVVITGGDGTITIDPSGKFAIESAADELITVIRDFTTVMAGAGIVPNVPFNPGTLSQIEQITARLEALII